ncbi:counting factor 60 [Nematostella vectensis]|uniref:counting factor 60 n=1 Tax=Nematostella vectensis TaxID=45351 RepID=UPI00207701BE|nr:counting factor 60 [Nematostella vectensis]
MSGSKAFFIVAAFSFLLCSVVSLPEYCGKPTEAKTLGLPEGFKLKQTHVIIRHGDRVRAGYHGPCWDGDKAIWDCTLTSASLPAIKHDSHYIVVDRIYRRVYLNGRESDAGDCAIGHLTLEGYKQQELNGQILRKVYVDTGFLKSNFSSTEMYLRSDDESRTMQSAQALILGMYPPATIASDRAQVADINTMDKLFDSIEPNTMLCPKLSEYNHGFLKTDMWRHHYNGITKPLLLEVQKALGSNKTLDIDGLDDLVDCIHTHQCHGFAIPPGITDDLFKRMVDELLYRWNSMYLYPSREKYATVGIGFLIKDIWQEVMESLTGESLRKFLLYSGHDGTIQPFLSAFNVTDFKWPPYASFLMLEILEVTGTPQAGTPQYAVRMLYNGELLKFPFCDANPCPMDQFEAYVNTIIPHNPAEDCKVSDPEVLNQKPIRFLPNRDG